MLVSGVVRGAEAGQVQRQRELADGAHGVALDVRARRRARSRRPGGAELEPAISASIDLAAGAEHLGAE